MFAFLSMYILKMSTLIDISQIIVLQIFKTQRNFFNSRKLLNNITIKYGWDENQKKRKSTCVPNL